MKCIARKVAIAALAAASSLVAAESHAKVKELKFHVVQDQFAEMPTLEMRYDGDKWVWANKGDGYNIKVKIKIDSSIYKVRGGVIDVPRANMALWAMPAGLETKDYEKLETVNVGKAMLSPFQGDAANLCSVFGGEKKSVRDLDATAVLSVIEIAETRSTKGVLPIKVVCLPKEPHRAPVDLTVTELKVYTLPANPLCGQPVHLVTEIHSNKPGNVNFTLFRKDGEKQDASLTTEKVADGYARRWSKNYVYNQSIKREYKVMVKGSELTSDWVAVEVKCGANADIKRPLKLTN
jgi:hypothetical protein